MKIAGSVLMLLGLLLLVLSFFWTKVMGDTPKMSEDELAAYSHASSELHRLVGAASSPQDRQAVEEAKTKIDEFNKVTENHEKLVKSSKNVVWILGIVMALSGVGLQIWHNQRAD